MQGTVLDYEDRYMSKADFCHKVDNKCSSLYGEERKRMPLPIWQAVKF